MTKKPNPASSQPFAPRRILPHGQILSRPAVSPSGTTGSVAYELGHCLQLDAETCLLIASMDEQGGGDLCVGNDAFLFRRLSDIRPENALPVNRVDPAYRRKDNGAQTFLAKFPCMGGFIPLGADHPAAGTGFLLSNCVTFSPGKASAEGSPESFLEKIEIRWDGSNLRFLPSTYVTELMGLPLNGDMLLGPFCPADEGLLVPLGIAEQGMVAFRFEWDGTQWHPTCHGAPFGENRGRSEAPLPGEPWTHPPGEIEASLRRTAEGTFLYTRGIDPVGRLYHSQDGLNYEPVRQRPNPTVPQILNQGLDGSLYVTTNRGAGWVRNPLTAWDLCSEEDSLLLHDQEGIRDDSKASIPFVDHAIGFNLHFEGRWHHLLFYRVCDLKERTLHQYQVDLGQSEAIHKAAPPSERKPTTGLYLIEMEFQHPGGFQELQFLRNLK